MECKQGFEVKALKSNMAYIGTLDEDGAPNCRCSEEYFKNIADAQKALDGGNFTPRWCMENNYCNKGDGCF